MRMIQRPSRDYFGGQIVTTDAFNKAQAVLGQITPRTRERFMEPAGRFLAGDDLAAEARSGWNDSLLSELERDDDVNGSGIFDAAGTSTVHRTMGVFEDHPSLPGYIARSPPFSVSEVTSPSGASVVEVPGGGMIYVETGGRRSRLVPGREAVPKLPRPPNPVVPIPAVSTVAAPRWEQPVAGLGATPSDPAPWGAYLFAGVLAGVAIGLVHHAVQKQRR